MSEKQPPNLREIEQLLRIHTLKLQLSSYERDLSKQYLWREWLKAAAAVIAFLGVGSTMIWTLIQTAESRRVRVEEDRARRFENAISRLGASAANSRLTGTAGLAEFIRATNPEYAAPAWNSLVHAVAVEDDVVVREALLESLRSLPASQQILNDALDTLVRLNRSLVTSLVNPAVKEGRLPSEPLSHSVRLAAMAGGINALIQRDAKTKDFAGIYCVDCDFRKISGDHVTFHTAMLDFADFKGVKLSAPDFSEASLTGADFAHAILRDANFDYADIKVLLWYQSFGGDPDPPNFWCADLSGSSFKGFLVSGFNVRKGKHAWYPSPLPGGMSFFGTSMRGAKIESLYEFFTSTEGPPTTTTVFDENEQLTFKDISGHERWIGFRVIPDDEPGDDEGDFAVWDQVAARSFNQIDDATGARLPEIVRRYLPSGAHAEIKEKCKEQ